MPRGEEGAKVAKEPSRARERIRPAVRETDKDVGLTIAFEFWNFRYCKIVTVPYNIS